MLAASSLWLANGYADEPRISAQSSRLTNRHPELEKYISTVRATNGLTLGISIIRLTIGTNSTELPVEFEFKAPSTTNSMLFMPKDEYLVRMELYDSNNVVVPKTELGTKYGKSFDDIYWDIGKFAKSPHGPTIVKDAWSWGRQLPKISDLFILTKSGAYHLKLEVQVMLYYLNMKEKQTRQILRFPPVEISVINPEVIPLENLPAISQTNSPAK